MQFIKKNLTVILLSVACTLLLVIVILLIVNNNTFKFSNNSSNNETEKENVKEIKESKKIEKKEEKEEVVEIEEKPVNNINNDTKNDNSNNSTNMNQNPNNPVEEKNEASLLSYFENESNMFNSKDTSITDRLKTSFTSIIDFIFYEKEIKGYTFKELTNSAKLKVIGLALAIDNKIDSYFPDYKEKIKGKYTSVKGTLALKYLEVTASFCNSNPDACKQAKVDFDAMKESFGFSFDLVKEVLKNGSSKVKELYENWRD